MVRSPNPSSRIRRPCLLLLLFIITCSLSVITAAQNGSDIHLLEPGKATERQLAGGETHTYRLPVAAGQYTRVVVYQRGIDVVVTLFDPGDTKITEVDTPNGANGPEPLSLISDAAQDCKLVVRALYADAPAGRYEVKIAEQRTATVQDHRRIAAERAFAQAVMLLNNGTAESRQRIVDKFEEALTLWRAAGDRREVAASLHSAAWAYGDIGEWQTTFDYLTQSLEIAREVGDRSLEAGAIGGLTWLHGGFGDPHTALEHNRQALQLAREIGDQRLEATSLRFLGDHYSALGQHQKGLNYHRLALSLTRIVADRRFESETNLAVGTVYESLGETKKALARYEEALRLMRLSRYRIGEAFTLSHIGWFYDRSLANERKALEYYQQALPMMSSIGNRLNEAATLYRASRAHYDLAEFAESLRNIEASLSIIEAMRAKITRNEMRRSYFATVQEYYEFYIELLMRLYKDQPSVRYAAMALHASERARARNMLELLAEARARSDVDPKLLKRERTLRQLLNAKAAVQTRLLTGKHTEQQAVKVEEEIKALMTEHEEVRGRIRNLRLRNSELPQTSPLTLSEIQTQVLDDDTLLLEYALGEERSFLWAVTPTSVTSYELPKRSEIERAARRVYELLTARNMHKTGETAAQKLARVAVADAQYEAAAAELSAMVLAPAAALLEKKRLLVVSDGVLQYIPFGALIDPRAPKTRDFLVKEHEVISLPSASVLAVQRRQTPGRPQASRPLAVIADPIFDLTDERARAIRKSSAMPLTMISDLARATRDVGIMPSSGPSQIRRLPFSRVEAESIIKTVPPGQAFHALDFRASREVATSADLAQYRVVHFASHGLLNNEHPELSGIILSLIDERGRPVDGFLRLNEIHNLKLPVELVVLSACQTALGKQVKGEGLVSLVRGFMYAGAERVIASLWRVDDEATAELMKIFYQRMLKDGMRPAAALGAAKSEMSRNRRWSSPYYWAAFELHGEWR